MKEILPGVHHWTAPHPAIKVEVSCYWLPDLGGGVLLDPLLPAEGLDAFRERPPREILLTNHHHYRHSDRFAEAVGCTVRCHRAGLHEFGEGRQVEPFDFGDMLAGEIEAVEVGSLYPDETALHIPAAGGILTLADALIRDGDGPLAFLPDAYIGQEPAKVKEGLTAAFRRLLERDFDHLLLAHGNPWIGGGKEALRRFVEGS